MRIMIPAALFASTFLAGCHYEMTIDIVQANEQVSFTAANNVKSCPTNIRVIPVATPFSPIWNISNDRPNPCLQRFTYGELPPGWREIGVTEKLIPGTTYTVSIKGGASMGQERFTFAP